MLGLESVLKDAVERKASDIFLVAGKPISYKINGLIIPQRESKLKADETKSLVETLYSMCYRSTKYLIKTGDDDFSFSLPEVSRFRVSTYKQRGSLAAVIRVIPFGIPDYKQLGIPENVISLAEKNKGLILVTGTAGSGKSTTLACIIDQINRSRNCHIVTLEDPIEYLHRNNKSVISQREIGIDTADYMTALRACMRQAPDVILLGEMRDYETIRIAMTAAETGHLVISSLHTLGSAKAVDRIIDVFPSHQQQQIRVQLAMILQTVVSQQLLPAKDGSRIPAFEIMNVNSAIRNMIRDSKLHQLDNVIATSASEGMVAMDNNLLDLYQRGIISAETAIHYAINIEAMGRKIGFLEE